MKKFTFACPVCGQHIAATEDQAGAQVECPSCFRALIVPSPPSEGSPKFILTAAECKPYTVYPTTQELSAGEEPSTSRIRRLVKWVGLCLLVIVVGSIAIWKIVFRDGTQVHATTDTLPGRSHSTNAGIGWAWDPEALNLVNHSLTGMLSGRPFAGNRAVLQGGILRLRQVGPTGPELEMTIDLRNFPLERLIGSKVTFKASDSNRPSLAVRWWENGQPIRRPVTDPFILGMELAAITSNSISGRLFCAIDDPGKSWVAGTFTAQLRERQARPRR